MARLGTLGLPAHAGAVVEMPLQEWTRHVELAQQAMNRHQYPEWIAYRWSEIFGQKAIDKNAIAKADRLLKKFLTLDQLAEYKATARITIINGEKKYSIGRDLFVRVYDINDYPLAPPLEVWCVRLPGTPLSDSLLAQLLFLRSNPGKLRRMACVSPGHRRRNYRVRDLLQRAGYVG